jgi:membrane protein implicated in regulation of membrane protease activity
MMGAGIAGFMWPSGPPDGTPATWHFYWLSVGFAGVVLLAAPETWRWFRRGARAEGDALFFLRVYTERNEWRPKHMVVLGVFAVSALVCQVVPDNSWWAWVALIWFLAMLRSLSILPLHRRRSQPKANGSARQS